MKTNKPINGVLILNKDTGESSNRSLQRAKRLFQAEKAGHTGSLDPLASGVLPICFGEATKYSRFLLDADKTYVVTAKLGVTTTTSDSEGEILETKPVPNFTLDQILHAIEQFRGASKQIPSMYSALKHQGQPLYKLARQNITVDRPARDIFVYEYEVLDFNTDVLKCRIKCSKGTYIRNLIEDLGAVLGCGAHVTALQRTQAGPFSLAQSYTIAELAEELESRHPGQDQALRHPGQDQALRHPGQDLPQVDLRCRDLLLSLETLIQDLPRLSLNDQQTININHGKVIEIAGQPLGIVALYNEQKFFGIGEIMPDGTLLARRLLAQNPV